MANAKKIESKAQEAKIIADKIENSQSVILVDYQGLNVADLSQIRTELRKSQSEFKIYKNTYVKRALDSLKIDLDDYLNGPNAIVFGNDLLEPIKVITDFAKTHDNLEVKVGVINGEVASKEVINEYASIPSMEGLLTMLAAGMMEHVRNLFICLDMYADNLEEK